MSDVNQVMVKLGKANKLMEELIDLAMADSKISKDEKDMLFSINDNLSKYAELIIETLEDGVVDEEEKKKIKLLENKIVTDAHYVAKGDESVSEEEKTLLTQLIKTIQEIRN